MNAFSHFIAQQMAQPQMTAAGRHARVTADPATLGDLDAAALDFIRTRPECGVGAIAAELGVDAPSLYPVLQKLRRCGLVVIAGRVGNGNLWKAA